MADLRKPRGRSTPCLKRQPRSIFFRPQPPHPFLPLGGEDERKCGPHTLELYSEHTRYDPFDKRIGRSVDPDGAGPEVAEQTWTVYDGANPYADFDGSGQLTVRYLYGPAVDMILARLEADGDLAWYLTDHLGTVRDIADPSGNVIDHIQYDSFGNVLSETDPAAGDRFKFTGREYDEATGQYYYRARYYDPATGRFTGEDPLRFQAGDANLYRYVGNGVTSAIDPSGLEEILPPPGLPREDPAWAYYEMQGYSPPPPPPDEGPGFGDLYWYYLTPGDSAPSDPWILNWGSEIAGGIGIAAGTAAAGIVLIGAAGGATSSAAAVPVASTEVAAASYPSAMVTTEVAGAAYAPALLTTELAVGPGAAVSATVVPQTLLAVEHVAFASGFTAAQTAMIVEALQASAALGIDTTALCGVYICELPAGYSASVGIMVECFELTLAPSAFQGGQATLNAIVAEELIHVAQTGATTEFSAQLIWMLEREAVVLNPFWPFLP